MANKKQNKPTITPPEETNVVHVRLEVTRIDKLDRLAKKNNLTRTDIIKQLIDQVDG